MTPVIVELDAAVAEHIMGWHWVQVDWLGNPVPEPVLVPARHSSAVAVPIPAYSSSWDSTWEVFRWMEDRLPDLGRVRPFLSLVSANGEYTCSVAHYREEAGGGVFALARAATAQEAICRCALMVAAKLKGEGE